MPIEQFMKFTAQHNAPLNYGAGDLEEDRLTLKRPWLVTVVSDSSPLIALARIHKLSLLADLFGRILVPAEPS